MQIEVKGRAVGSDQAAMTRTARLFPLDKPDHFRLVMVVVQVGGAPSCATGRTLGLRVPEDIRPDAEGRVHPGTGGMSVALDDPDATAATPSPPHAPRDRS